MQSQSKSFIESVRSNISKISWLSKVVKQFYYALPTQIRSIFGINDYRTPVELKLKPLIKNRDNFFFIKIGANDGLRSDPIAALIKQYRWSGIMVEPVKYLFERLERNYEKFPNIQCVNAAIANLNGKKTFYSIREKRPGEDLPIWHDGINSFNLDTVLKHKHSFPNIEDYLIQTEVECLTFAHLIKEYQVSQLNLLHIDTEGYDYEIIKLVDFEKIKPEIILYENKHLQNFEKQACEDFLAKEGYTVVDLSGDTLAYQS